MVTTSLMKAVGFSDLPVLASTVLIRDGLFIDALDIEISMICGTGTRMIICTRRVYVVCWNVSDRLVGECVHAGLTK